MLIDLGRVRARLRPDLVVVVGDVNSSAAGAIAAATLGIPVAHRGMAALLRPDDARGGEPRHHRCVERHLGLGAALAGIPGLRPTPPLGYLDMLALIERARLVLTDSDGVQEETTYLGVPCLTLRDTTERPATVSNGTNRVVGARPERVLAEIERVLAGDRPPARRPPLWDGRAAESVVDVLAGVSRMRTRPGPAAGQD
jgi:UDP-N-acetylglucosamine 2-epimerase